MKTLLLSVVLAVAAIGLLAGPARVAVADSSMCPSPSSFNRWLGPPTISSSSVSGSVITLRVSPPGLENVPPGPNGESYVERLEGYKLQVRENGSWGAWSSSWVNSSTLRYTVSNPDKRRYLVRVVACVSANAPSWSAADRWYYNSPGATAVARR